MTLNLNVLANHPDVAKIENEGRAVTTDIDGNYMEFIIRNIEDIYGAEGLFKSVKGEGGEYELIDEWLPSYIQPRVSLKTALTAVLQSTRYELGEIDDFYHDQSVDLRHMTVRQAVNELINQWGGEVRYRVEIKGNRIARRYIDVFKMRGTDTGKRFEDGRDVLSANRVLDTTEIKTALYGVGAADENGDRLTFADVEWRKEWGDPVDKPLGQTWVGDPDAMARWGAQGGRKHKTGGYDGQEEDPAELLLNTWNHLQTLVKLRDTYELDVVQLGEILDYPHEKVRLGDRVRAIVNRMNPPIQSQASVIEYHHNLNNRKESRCTLGHFRAKLNTNRRVADLEKDWNDNKGKFDKAPEKVKEDVLSETQQMVNDAIDESQERIDQAKEDLEKAMIDLDDAMEVADDVFENKLLQPQNYKGYFEGDVGITGELHVSGTIIGGSGATIQGTINAENLNLLQANILNANLKNVVISGELDYVSGTFTGDLIGTRIYTQDTVFVGSTLRVSENIELGEQGLSSTTKRIRFNDQASIIGGGGMYFNDLELNAGNVWLTGNLGDLHTVKVGNTSYIGWGSGSYKPRTSIYEDSSDRRLKLEVDDGQSGIWMDPSGTVYIRVKGVNRHVFYNDGGYVHNTD